MENIKADKILIVVDVQNDFVDGVFGTEEARAVVPKVVEKIKNFHGKVLVTKDIHFSKDDDVKDTYVYENTLEGKHFPKHCIIGTCGVNLNKSIFDALSNHSGASIISKTTFAYPYLDEMVKGVHDAADHIEYIEIVGLCTDICVISNALFLRTMLPNTRIIVDSNCCAGTTPEMHQKALDVMKSCLIEVI